MTDWFLRGLPGNIEILERQIAALKTHQLEAATALRSQARSLVEKAAYYGSPDISRTALRVVSSTERDFESSVRALLDTLIKAKAALAEEPPSVLVIGGSGQFVSLLREALALETDRIVQAPSAAEADRILIETRVAVIVVNLILPDTDGAAFCVRLGDSPSTASIPRLVLGASLSDSQKNRLRLSDASGYMEGEADATRAAAWVAGRLRRAQRKARKPSRDRPTGLLNRAAFATSYQDLLKDCEASQEPLSLVILRPDQSPTQDVVTRIGVILSDRFRSTDILARWDDITFGVLLPGEDQFGARKAVERSQRAVSEAEARTGASLESPVSLSAGITVVSSDQSFEEASTDAENCLARAMEAGSGRIVARQSYVIRRPESVLLVTGDPLMSKVLAGVLEKHGFRVAVAADNQHAVGLCHGRRRFQLILIDERIPGGGSDALKSMKEMERNRHVPAVMVLDQESVERRTDFEGMGAVECFARPFDVSACVARLQELVQTASSFRDPLRNTCRVLVVDDDPAQLYLAASALNAHGGFLVSLAKGEADGAKRLHDEAFEALIVPDAALVRLHTGEFRLRGTTVSSLQMGIIVTTDSALPRSDAVDEGITGVLKKPLDWLSLGRTIEEMLGLASSRRRDRGPSDHVNRELQRVAAPAAPADS